VNGSHIQEIKGISNILMVCFVLLTTELKETTDLQDFRTFKVRFDIKVYQLAGVVRNLKFKATSGPF